MKLELIKVFWGVKKMKKYNKVISLYLKTLFFVFFVLIMAMSTSLLWRTAHAEDRLGGEQENVGEDTEEIVYNASGWIPETFQTKQSVSAYIAPTISLASSEIIDYTDVFPNPGNQGNQGSCVGWAVGYAAKSYLVNIGQKWGVKDHQFSPSYIYNQINDGVDEGSSIYEALQLVIEQGVCLLTDMPYNQNDFTTQPNQTQRAIAEQYRSLSMKRIADGNVNDMKAALRDGIPIVIGIPVYPDFDNLDSSNSIYDNNSGVSRGNHAICLIGYNDETNSFKFINSWGASWGVSGYGYISYSLIETFNTTGWILYDAKIGLFANSCFNGTGLVQYIPIKDNIVSIEIFDGITSIGSNAFANQTQVTSITLPSTITNIGANAFSGCTSLTSINIPENVTSIGAGAFVGCSSLTNITIPAGVTSVGEGAFAECSNLNISVSTSNPNYSAQGNVLYNKAKTKIIGSGDIAANITISNTVTEVGVSAFSGNTNLQRVEIYGMPVIDDFAFYDCANLDKVYFYSYTVPEIGSNAFADNEFTLYVPHSKQSAYNTEFAGYTNNISSIPIEITLYVDGEEYDTLDTYYGASIVGVENPFKEGYTFNYWIDAAGNTYQNGDIWDSTVDLSVEADWTARQAYINFAGYGTEGITDKLVTYDKKIGALPVPNVTGPTFIGWKDENGTPYTSDTIWRRTNNLTLMADYEGEEVGNTILYYVDLDQDGGVGGSDNVKAEYLAPMPTATKPTRAGYTFNGYYTGKNGTGVKYYNADMSSARNWDIASDKTLYAYWVGLKFTVSFAQEGGSGGTSSVQVTYGSVMPTSGLVAPTRLGYTFDGYYDKDGNQYYVGPNMSSNKAWDKLTSTTLYAKWIRKEYTITLVLYDGMTTEVTVYYGDQVEVKYAPTRSHYEFKGYYSQPNGQGKQYVKGVLGQPFNDYYEIVPESTSATWNQDSDGVLYAHWELLKANCSITVYSVGIEYLAPRTISITSGQSMTLNANTPSGYTFVNWEINGVKYTTENVTYTFELHRSYITGEITIHTDNYSTSAAYSDGYILLSFQKNPEDNCVAAGTLITLADGRQVPVELLTGNEMLLVWNLNTGSFDVAPILFIDHDAAAMYKIINLQFSDGTQVKVIYEHAFWDFNLNKYVFLREDAAQYVGHWFNKQTTDANGNMIWTRVQLTNVTITEEYTTAWSPVTYGHLCIYVNGMLSMPGATEGLINIFEVDGDTMQIDQEQYLADIATYGLFTYEEFAEIYPIPETIFEAFGGEYLKVSIGKGLIDYETLGELIERYSEFFA